MSIKVEFIPPEKWWQRAKWRLLEDYVSQNSHVLVPTGFISDGASVPRLLNWLFLPTGRYFGAALIHDYVIYAEHDWTKANHEFENELDALNIPNWRNWMLKTAVKWYWFCKRLVQE